MKKILSILLAVTMIVSLMVGCSSNKLAADSVGGVTNNITSNNGFNSGNMIAGPSKNESVDSNMDYVTGGTTTNPEFEDTTENFVERKIVYYVQAELQTKDLDAAMNVLNENIQENEGYIQSQNQYNNGSIYDKYQRRYVKMTIRIPSENLEAFLSGLENDNMYTISLNKDSKDYSESYYDKDTRVKNLKIQEDRLLELLTQANDIKTMLDIEERLSNIRYEIEKLTKEMNIIDAQVDYSTITLSMTEVVKYNEIQEEPENFFERAKEAIKESWENFVDGIQDFIIGLIYALPTLIILSIIVFVVVLIAKKKHKEKNNNAKSETYIDNENTKE